jgi:ribonuclease M5
MEKKKAKIMMNSDFIKEVIIVEGRDDIDAVQKAVNADIIATHGYGISRATLKQIENAYRTRGIIILTDPDHAGTKIRQRLTEMFPAALQAYISKSDALDKSETDIGVENARPETIAKAIEAAGRTLTEQHTEFTQKDMMYYGLAAGEGSKELRDALGRRLGIGYANSKGFLKRLNNYGINRDELEKALKEILTER